MATTPAWTWTDEELADACARAIPGCVLLPPMIAKTPDAPDVPTPAGLAPVVAALRPGERAVVIVSDQTRKTGADHVLPVLWDGWRSRGVTRHDRIGILGPSIAAEFSDRILAHDAFASPCASLGRTSRGTPIEVNRLAVDADAVIPIGGVVFHYFAGFTGGRKSIVPGVASARTIAANHSLTLDTVRRAWHPAVEIGRLPGNPVAEDLAEAAAAVPVRASVQTVLDGNGRFAGVFAGEMTQAHRDACDCARRLFGVTLGDPADVAVATAGPARNWLQSHKALVNASRAIRPDGVIVLVAPCPEGIGSASLERWLAAPSLDAIMDGIADSADINAQTALSSRTRGRKTILVSGLPHDAVARMGMEPADSLPAALRAAQARIGPRPDPVRVLPMPQAWVTVPFPAA
jgi:nickel-dependent lactate racemase